MDRAARGTPDLLSHVFRPKADHHEVRRETVSTPWDAAKGGLMAGAAFAVLEAGLALYMPVALDPSPTPLVLVASVLGTAVLIGVLSWLSSAVNTRSAVGIALALWAAAWGPHNARLAGWHRVGWAPSVVIGGTALVAPGVGVALGVLGGASAGLFRSRGGPEGLQPIRREAGNRDAQPDIVLVTVDAIRADSGLMHEGQWRADSPFSPTQGWTHFTDAVSAAPWSLPSVHSLLSGMPVNEHGGGLDLGDSFSRRVPDAVPMPYRLQQAGYETRALVSNPFLAIEQGFADGFDRWSHSAEVAEPILLLDVYNRVMSWSTGKPRDIDLERNQRLVRAAEALLETPSVRPRFLWIHLTPRRAHIDGGALDGPAYEERLQQTRLLLARINRASSGAIMAVVGTHGEAHGENGRWGDGSALGDPELSVPMAIRRPGTQGGVVSRPVATADIARTLLAAGADARHYPGQHLMQVRTKPIEVGGTRTSDHRFAARTTSGHYIEREAGVVGPGVKASDRTEENLRLSGYLD